MERMPESFEHYNFTRDGQGYLKFDLAKAKTLCRKS